jgi:succinate-acetate transporter protein
VGAAMQAIQTPQAAPATRAAQAVEFTTPPPTRIFLQPVASPSVLGLYAFSAATLIFGAFYAGWFGSAITPQYIAPFLALLGLAQLLAGMWAYKARDGLATVTHGIWGAFWLAYGIVYLLIGNGTLNAAAFLPQFGWWFIPLVGITLVAMFASLGRNLAGSATWLLLAVAGLLACIGFLTARSTWNTVGGYFFMASALFAFYTASAMLLEDTYRRVVLPIGKPRMEANIPGRQVTKFVEYQYGEPGIRAGQ